MTLPITIPSLFMTTAVLLSAAGSALGRASGDTPAGARLQSASVESAHVPFARGVRPAHSFVVFARVTRPDSTPLYTEEQATAGEVVFGKVCAECHEKKDVAGADFRSKWNGRTLLELYELIRTTMPDSNPGAMSRDEYAGALAYILKLNGLPAGPAAVMPDSGAMSAATLVLPPPAP